MHRLDGSRLKDGRRIKDMLDRVELPSVNQLAATVKLTEAWKTVNVVNYPISLLPTKVKMSEHMVRSGTRKQFNEYAKLKVSKSSFVYDAAKLWNQAPQTIKDCKSLQSAKRTINQYCKSLPI